MDFLDAGKKTESSISFDDFYALGKSYGASPSSDSTEAPHAFEIQDRSAIDFIDVFGQSYAGDTPPSAAYVGCQILSKETCSAILLVGSSDESKIWINGSLICNARSRRGLYRFSDAIPITLKRGENFLLIKVVRWKGAFGLTARIEPNPETAALAALEGHGMIHGLLLRESVLKPGEKIEFAPRGVPEDVSIRAEIRELQDRLVVSKTFPRSNGSWDLGSTLAEGLYQFTLVVGDRSFSQPFLVGSPDAFAERLKLRQVALINVAESDQLNLTGIERRVEIICNPANKKRDSRTLVYSLLEWETALTDLESQTVAFRGRAGLHLRAFKSSIDDQVEYYRIFVPKTYAAGDKPLPLVVITPTIISAARPFIESPFMAAHSEAERMCTIAERLGLGLVWSGYRNKPEGQLLESAHLDEVLTAIRQDYKIDATRITLLGVCSGAASAMMDVATCSERFAGAAFLNPVVGLIRNVNRQNSIVFRRSIEFQQWLHRDYIHPFLSHNVPTFVVHDGAEVGHGSLNEAQFLVDQAASEGIKIRFERRPQTAAQHFAAYEELLSWLALQKIETAPPAAAAKSKLVDSLHGIQLAFTHRFLLVIGTEGTTAEQAEMRRIGEEFSQSWRTNQFGSCIVMTDRELSANPQKDVNLILVGNERTNLIWGRFAADIPIFMDEGKIIAGKGTWIGNNLALEAVIDNPTESGRKIVLLGAHKLEDAKFNNVCLPSEGWFDFAIWNQSGERRKLVAAGYW